MNTPFQKNRGFTLIEVLTTLSLISLLMSVIIVSLISVKKQSQESNGEVQTQNVLVALEFYYNTTGNYPVPDSVPLTPIISADVDGDDINDSVKACCASGTQCLLAGEEVYACVAIVAGVAEAPAEEALLAAVPVIAPAQSPAITINGEVWQGIMYVCERPNSKGCPERSSYYLRGLPISGIKYVPIKPDLGETTYSTETNTETSSTLINPLESYNSALTYYSCHEQDALNYDPEGMEDNSLCFHAAQQRGGCTDSSDPEYDSDATYSNGSCASDYYVESQE